MSVFDAHARADLGVMLTVDQAAALTALHHTTVRAAIAFGDLTACGGSRDSELPSASRHPSRCQALAPTRNYRWYRVRYREAGNGNGNAKMRTFDTRKEAEAFDFMVKASKLGGPPAPAKRQATQSLGAFAREYRDVYASVELSANTLAVQRSIFNRWIEPRLARLPLNAVTPEVVQRFKADLVAEGIGDGALSKTLAILSAIMGKAVEWGRIERNPVSSVRKPPQRRRRVITALSPAEVERIRSAMPTETDGLLVSVLAYAGLRPGESYTQKLWMDLRMKAAYLPG